MPRYANATETLEDIAAEIFPDTGETQNQATDQEQEQNALDQETHENEQEQEQTSEVETQSQDEQQSVGDGESEEENSGFNTLNELLSQVVEHDDLPSVYQLPIKLDSGETVILSEVKDQLQARDRRIQEQEQQLQAASAASSNQSMSMAPPPEVIEAIATIRSLADQWNQLEAQKEKLDPGKLALARQDLEGRYQTAVYERDQALQKHRTEVMAKRQEFVNGQVKKLVENRSELKDPEKMKNAIGMIQDTAKLYGLTQAEVMQIADHRHINMILDLAAYKAREKEGQKLLNKSKRGSVVRLKAGARKGAPKKGKKTRDLEKQARANPRDKSALAAALNAIADEGGIKAR